jgi:preprotein translocase subunit YajC
MSQFLFLLETGAAATETPGGSMLNVFILYGGFLALLWFILIRPQRKRQKEIQSMQNEVKVGDSVLTTGGLYGKVVDQVNDLLIVEFGTNKSVRVPMQRVAVASVREPELTIVKEEE